MTESRFVPRAAWSRGKLCQFLSSQITGLSLTMSLAYGLNLK